MFLHDWRPDPVLVTLGPLKLRWYGLLVGTGAWVGYVVARALSARYGVDRAHFGTLLLICLPLGLLGGRLYHVANEWEYYRAHPERILQIWQGGLAIHGCIVASVIVFALYARLHRLSFWQLADVGAVGLVLGQAIGRWGNYFNQELFGRPTDRPWGIPIDVQNRPPGYEDFSHFHPTFLYESLGCFAIAGILLGLHHWRLRAERHGRSAGAFAAPGSIAMAYFVLYSIVRIVTESLRIDDVPLVAGVRLPLLMSFVLIAMALVLWIVLWARHRTQRAAIRAAGP
jgi:phosphatidylglycerol:prolipoprotein diacylglycerol transferase